MTGLDANSIALDPIGPDPIALEILHNALRSVTDEMFIALMRSAYSTNIKERNDHSTALMSADGRLVVQAERSLPIHLGSMAGLMRALLARYPLAAIEEGDVFVANDPYAAGGTHLPDVNMAMPVFAEGRLLCFVCNIAHHADIGGMAPGSMAGGMSEIYQEGLRIPVVRILRRDVLVDEMLDLLLLNQRVPEERRGDYFAQIASCKLGARRMAELAARQGGALLATAFDEIIRRTRQRISAAIAALPAGTHRFEDVMDDDGLGTRDIPIRLTLTIDPAAEPPRLVFDFAGSAPQVRGNINLTLNATQASVLYAVKCLLDPEAPNNQGLLDALEIRVPEGSIVNAGFPAAVAARANTCQRVIDVILGAFAAVLPERVVGAANGANTTIVFSGRDPATGRAYVYLETLGGGFGGRAGRDGKDGVQVHITNTSNLPVEAIEAEYPLRIERYELVENSGGSGRHRGGLGLRRVVRPVGHTAEFSGQGERFVHAPWGIFGGGPGRPGRFQRRDAGGALHLLATKPSGISVPPEEAVIVETPGAGGYGPASERSPAERERDRRSGKAE